MTNALRIVDDVTWTDLGDEVVILKLDTGIYFGLNQIASGSVHDGVMLTPLRREGLL